MLSNDFVLRLDLVLDISSLLGGDLGSSLEVLLRGLGPALKISQLLSGFLISLGLGHFLVGWLSELCALGSDIVENFELLVSSVGGDVGELKHQSGKVHLVLGFLLAKGVRLFFGRSLGNLEGNGSVSDLLQSGRLFLDVGLEVARIRLALATSLQEGIGSGVDVLERIRERFLSGLKGKLQIGHVLFLLGFLAGTAALDCKVDGSVGLLELGRESDHVLTGVPQLFELSLILLFGHELLDGDAGALGLVLLAGNELLLGSGNLFLLGESVPLGVMSATLDERILDGSVSDVVILLGGGLEVLLGEEILVDSLLLQLSSRALLVEAQEQGNDSHGGSFEHNYFIINGFV